MEGTTFGWTAMMKDLAGCLLYSGMSDTVWLDGDPFWRTELVRKQTGRLHANPYGLGRICFKRERFERTEPVRSIRKWLQILIYLLLMLELVYEKNVIFLLQNWSVSQKAYMVCILKGSVYRSSIILSHWGRKVRTHAYYVKILNILMTLYL